MQPFMPQGKWCRVLTKTFEQGSKEQNEQMGKPVLEEYLPTSSLCSNDT